MTIALIYCGKQSGIKMMFQQRIIEQLAKKRNGEWRKQDNEYYNAVTKRVSRDIIWKGLNRKALNVSRLSF